jgi:hypothetical protein
MSSIKTWSPSKLSFTLVLGTLLLIGLLAMLEKSNNPTRPDSPELEKARKSLEEAKEKAAAKLKAMSPEELLTARRQLKEAEDAQAAEKDPLEIVKKNWEKGGFGMISIWNVTFRNRSRKPVGNIRYRTAYYSETRNKVGSGGVDSSAGDYTIQKIILPQSTRTLEINDGYVNDQAVSATFEIVSWEFISQ